MNEQAHHDDNTPPLSAYDDDLERNGSRVIDLGEHRNKGKQKKGKQARKPSFVGSFDFPEQMTSGPRARSVANFRAYCAAIGLRFRFNEMALVIEVQRGANAEWEPMTDAIENAEWLRLTAGGCDMPATFWRACAVDEAHQNAYDPGREWVQSLVWDGTPRVDTVFIRLGGAPDTPLIRAMTGAFFVGAVRRMLQPGCQHDQVPLLESRQGFRKSTAVRILSPREEWISDCLDVGSAPKEVIEQTAGKFIVELAEMAGLTKKEVERTKAFVTRRVDRARLSYGRNAIDVPRRFVCIGTINPDSTGTYLNDPTGGRRWWPIPLTSPIDCEALADERDQLWAEAAHREAEGELSYLTPEMEAEARVSQEARVIEDPWVDALAGLTIGQPRHITVADAWKAVAPDTSKQDANLGRRLSNCMQKLGYVKGTRWCSATLKTLKVFRRADAADDEVRP